MISDAEQQRLKADADRVIKARPETFSALQGARIYLTGGTGFVGSWLLEVLTRANDTLGLDVKVTVLTRSPATFATSTPHLFYHSAVRFQSGDVETCTIAPGHTHVIHAALPVGDPALGIVPLLKKSIMAGAGRFLFVSSGAVYGKVQEDLAYKNGKRVAEKLCEAANVEGAFDVAIARCYTFLGPYFPIHKHYAISRFLQAVMDNEPISVHGDGTTMRSYMYGADLTLQLLMLLSSKRTEPDGRARIVDVGSDVLVSMRRLATIVPRALGRASHPTNVEKQLPTEVREIYAPRSWEEQLDLPLNFGLLESILRMAQFHGWEE